VAGQALDASRTFRANPFAIGLVVVLFAYRLFRFFQTPTLDAERRRSVRWALLALGALSIFVMVAPRLLPPPIYENANYIIDPTDYRYWVRQIALYSSLPDILAGVATIRIVDVLTQTRNRGELDFTATFLMSALYGLYCVLKVWLVARLIFLVGKARSAWLRRASPA